MQSIATSEDAEVGQRSSRGRTVKSMCEFRIMMDFEAAGSLFWFWCSCTSRQTSCSLHHVMLLPTNSSCVSITGFRSLAVSINRFLLQHLGFRNSRVHRNAARVTGPRDL